MLTTRTYARIENGAVAEVVTLAATISISDAFHPSLTFVEISDLSPQPQFGWLYNNGVFSAPSNTIPPSQQALAMLAKGFEVVSSSTPSINGTYAADVIAQQHIMAEVTSILLNNTFTDGSTTMEWPDTSGVNHAMTIAQYKSWATAHGAFVTSCLRVMSGQSTTLPAQPATIA